MDSPPSAASPSRVALAVKGWRCWLGWHRWKLTYVCDRTYLGGRDYWEVYEECQRCGEERSYDERNRRVADALKEVVEFEREDAEVRALSEEDDHAVT